MDRRSEPRLPTETPVRVEALRGASIEMDGTIVNTSGRGLCVRVPQPLNASELVRLTTDNYHSIAIVRYCGPEGDLFSAGMERAGEWRQRPVGAPLPDLATLPVPHAAPQEQLKADFDGVRTAALQALVADAVKPPPPAARRSRTPMVIAAAAGVVLLGTLLGVWLLGSPAGL